MKHFSLIAIMILISTGDKGSSSSLVQRGYRRCRGVE
jgi:hypothetical protein